MDRHDIARAIEADPVAAYDAHCRAGWGKGLSHIPPHMHGGMIRYILFGIPPGSFLSAVLRGDLFDACDRADDTNRESLFRYALFLRNYAPRGCYGSAEHVRDWITEGGWIGQEETAA